MAGPVTKKSRKQYREKQRDAKDKRMSAKYKKIWLTGI